MAYRVSLPRDIQTMAAEQLSLFARCMTCLIRDGHPCSLISTFVVCCLDSMESVVSISKISSLYIASVAMQVSLSYPGCKPQKTGDKA